MLADVHMGGHRGKAYLERTVAAINALDPDIIVMPGDLADGTAILKDENFAPLARLKAPAYFATGNHDTYVDEKKLLAIAARQGVHVLHNQVASVDGLQIAGLDYMNADDKAFDLHPSPGKATIEKMLPKLRLDPSRPSILIHHSPVGTPYAERAGVDLFIAGHTHGGGQIFPATLLAKWLVYPYSDGLYASAKCNFSSRRASEPSCCRCASARGTNSRCSACGRRADRRSPIAAVRHGSPRMQHGELTIDVHDEVGLGDATAFLPMDADAFPAFSFSHCFSWG